MGKKEAERADDRTRPDSEVLASFGRRDRGRRGGTDRNDRHVVDHAHLRQIGRVDLLMHDQTIDLRQRVPDLAEAQQFAAVVVVERPVERDDDALVVEESLDQLGHSAELEESEVELDVDDLRGRKSECVLEGIEVGLPTVLPGSDHTELGDRVDRLDVHLAEDLVVDSVP